MALLHRSPASWAVLAAASVSLEAVSASLLSGLSQPMLPVSSHWPMAWGLVSSQPRATGPRGAWARLLSLSAEADLLAFFPNNHFDFAGFSRVCVGEEGLDLDRALGAGLGDEGRDREC